MAAKLKSITRQIHWSLLLKGVAFGAAWLYLPFWLFLVVALYCYFIPLFRTNTLAVPFGALLVVSTFHAPDAFMALIIGVIFYYLLLIKDFLLIDRTTARSLLAMGLSFLLFREFYFGFANGPIGGALFGALALAALFGFLMHNLIGNFHNAHEDKDRGAMQTVASWLSFFVMAECLVIGLFLPLNFIYQSLLVFMVAALIIDFVPNRMFEILSHEKIRLTSAVFFALSVIILASARWGL